MQKATSGLKKIVPEVLPGDVWCGWGYIQGLTQHSPHSGAKELPQSSAKPYKSILKNLSFCRRCYLKWHQFAPLTDIRTAYSKGKYYVCPSCFMFFFVTVLKEFSLGIVWMHVLSSLFFKAVLALVDKGCVYHITTKYSFNLINRYMKWWNENSGTCQTCKLLGDGMPQYLCIPKDCVSQKHKARLWILIWSTSIDKNYLNTWNLCRFGICGWWCICLTFCFYRILFSL